ncbi:MAG: type II toxin-antitoxin system prevent-host-death family antitoxin [Beijerinckiaceae bacterium]|jgi:prevent-host-death family protein
MQISITEAESRLDELVDRAEAGDEVILTCNGRPVVQLVPIEKEARSGAAPPQGG